MGQSGIAVHDFEEQLEFSEAASDEPFWDAVYQKAFPDMVGQFACKGNNTGQRLGIDRVVQLASGKTLYIDEKKRRKVYDDILLEYISVDTTGALGWMEKDLSIDYLAYAFMPTGRVYLFPWEILRRAWRLYKADWMDKYRKVPAQNPGYRTWSVAVPIKVLRQAVSSASSVQVSV